MCTSEYFDSFLIKVNSKIKDPNKLKVIMNSEAQKSLRISRMLKNYDSNDKTAIKNRNINLNCDLKIQKNYNRKNFLFNKGYMKFKRNTFDHTSKFHFR